MIKTFRSKVFASGMPSDNFFERLRELAGITPKTFREFCNVLPPPNTTLDSDLEERLISIAKQGGKSLRTAIEAISAAVSISEMMEENKDDLSAILDDACSAKKLTDGERAAIEENLDVYQQTVQAGIESELSAQLRFSGTFPTIAHIRTRISSFIVYGKEYVATDNEEDYDPESCRQELAAIIQIDIDMFGDVQRLSFGLREKELDLMIVRLKLARKQLTYAKSELING